jgi:parallel beta-helix repeat protein
MRNKTRAVVEMTIGLVVIAGSVQADPTLINTCPVVITSAGDYSLSADLICGGGDGITIKAANLTLKLEGHRITAGAGANRAIFVDGFTARAGNPRILGPGLITNGGGNAFSEGVRLINLVNGEVSGITVLGVGSGIVCGLCNFVTITRNTLGRNATGMALGDSAFNTISENDASGNGTGIAINNQSGASLGMVIHNIVNGNTGDGVDVEGIVTVQNNVVSGNGQDGIHVAFGFGDFEGSAVSENTSLANGKFDLFDESPGCVGQVFSGDTFFTANQGCIH